MEEIDIEVATTTTTTAPNSAAHSDTTTLHHLGNPETAETTNQNDDRNMNDFIVRMYIHPFQFYPKPKITPVHHVQHLPSSPSSSSLLSTTTSSSSLLSTTACDTTRLLSPFVAVESNNKVHDNEEQKEEWKAIWQHWNDVLEQDKINLMQVSMVARLMSGFVILVVVDLHMILCMDQASDNDNTTWTALLKSFYYGLSVVLFISLIMFVIHTFVMYSDNDHNGTNHSRRDVHPVINGHRNGAHNDHHPPNAITTNRFLLVVANAQHRVSTSSSIRLTLLPFILIFGVWGVASCISYQIETSPFNRRWCYIIFFGIPMASVSFCVLYHIGGWKPVYEACRNRFYYTINRYDRVLTKIYRDIQRHNDAWTYFTLHPKIQFDLCQIVVDVYYKRTASSGNYLLLDNHGALVPSQSMNLVSSSNCGVTKRRGGIVNDTYDCNGFITVIDTNSCDPQQQHQRIDNHHFYDDDTDGLATPLLKKDTSV